MNLRRLAVILILAAVVAGVVILAGGESGAAGGGTAVLRRPDDQAAAPAFAAGETAAPALADVRELTPASAEAARPAADSALRITVLHADDVPAAGCLVLVEPFDSLSWRATTDEHGTVSGPAVSNDGLIWIDGPLLAPSSYDLTVRRGDVTLRLPPGGILEGRALVDGAPPREPFALTLGPRGELTDLPQATEMLLTRTDLGDAAIEDRAGLLVREDGAFRFSGLPVGWSGTFSLPGNMTAEEGEDLAALAGDRARTLRLHRVPRIFMRFLLPTGEPAAGAHVEATTRSASGSNGYELTADDEGRTDVPMNTWEPTTSIKLAVVDAAGGARLDSWHPVPDPLHDLDLGDLRLDPAWTVRFRALDPNGGPLADAIGGTECPRLAQSKPTGFDGVGTIAGVQPGCAELQVGAARHEIASVALPMPLPDEPIDVVLSPCAHLEVHVVPGDGRPRPGFVLHFQTVTHAERWTQDSGFASAAHRLGTTQAPWGSYTSMRNADGSYTLEMGRDYSVPDSGEVVIGCVEPGDPLDLSLVDSARHVLWTRETFTMKPAEQVVVTVPVSAVPGTLDVLVTDVAGAPVAGAIVGLVDAQLPDTRNTAQQLETQTGGSGRARFEALYAPTVSLQCECPGYATAQLPAVAVPGVEHVVLIRGLTVTVHFTDAQGRPSPVPQAWMARADGEPLHPVVHWLDDDSEDGVPPANWRFDDLPDVPLLIGASVTGRKLTWPHDPHVAEAHCVVPDTGSLLVRGLAPAAEENVQLIVQSGAVESERDVAWLDNEDLAAGTRRFPVLLAGSYRVTLVSHPGGTAPDIVLRGPVAAEIRTGQQTTVDLP